MKILVNTFPETFSYTGAYVYAVMKVHSMYAVLKANFFNIILLL